jgi:hypothetical protein
MIDKMNVIGPQQLRLKESLTRHLNDEKNAKILKFGSDQYYERTAVLSAIKLSDTKGLDVRLSWGNRFQRDSGIKAEIFEMGSKNISDVYAILGEVFDGAPDEADFVRLDLTADVENIPVSDFEQGMYVAYKQRSQTEHSDTGPRINRGFRRGAAETLYFGGIKSGQVKIYNKTEHRKLLLMNENKRLRRFSNPFVPFVPITFEERWGYDSGEIRTRIEKQCGSRLAAELWGIEKLGQAYMLADVEPFIGFRFQGDAKKNKQLEDLDPAMRGFIILLRRLAVTDSVAEMRRFLKSLYPNPASLRQFWKRHERLIMPETQLTREFLNAEYRRTTLVQLAA